MIEQRARAIDLAREELQQRETIEAGLRDLVDTVADALREGRAYRRPEPAVPPEVVAARKLARRIERALERSRRIPAVRNVKAARRLRVAA